MIEFVSYLGDLFCAFLFIRNTIVCPPPEGGHIQVVQHWQVLPALLAKILSYLHLL